jgi:16S rRNA (guanine527-N7)-methyltransferase
LKIITKYFPELSSKQTEQFFMLEELYSTWNNKINVISRKDIDHLYERHVLHSLSIAKIIHFKPGTELLDLGTGGGFPGIPLAILFPECHFVLSDSIGKKIKVVKEISEKLGLNNVIPLHKHSNEIKLKFDFVISRAVTAFPEFVRLINNKIKKEKKNSLQNGIIYLKGGMLDEEIKDYKKNIILHPISNFFSEEYFLSKYILYFPVYL